MARLVGQGADGIVLGCTEIELLVRAEDASVPVLLTTALHVEAALEAARVGGLLSRDAGLRRVSPRAASCGLGACGEPCWRGSRALPASRRRARVGRLD
jgi:hypothetical protein